MGDKDNDELRYDRQKREENRRNRQSIWLVH